jgi:transcription elongation factor GreA
MTTQPAPLMTATELNGLRAELERLRERHREEISEELRDARSYGGGSNNDEYHALREEQMVVEARISALEDTVATATVLYPDDAADGIVTIGSRVVLEDLPSGKTRTYRLAGAYFVDPDAISAASPMGRALIGAVERTVVTVDLPHQRSRSVRVIAVENPATAL